MTRPLLAITALLFTPSTWAADALPVQPRSAEGHYNLALVYLHDGKTAEARSELERAVALNPRLPDAAYNLGLVLLGLHEPRQAIGLLRQASALQPSRADAAYNLVLAYLESGDTQGAREQASHTHAAFAGDTQWQAAVGKLFLDFGCSPRTPQEHFLVAQALFASRRLREAAAESNEALRGNAKDPRYLILRARLHQTVGEQPDAIALFNQAATYAPQSAEPLYGVAVSYYFNHRYAEVRTSLTKALKLNPRSSRSLFLYAITCVNQGNDKAAEDYLRRALHLEPGNARYWFHLGTALLRENRDADASFAFAKATQLEPHYALPHYELGKLLARQGQLQSAYEELMKATANQPGLAQAYYQLARVSASLGRNDESAQALSTFQALRKADDTQVVFADVEGALTQQ